MIEFNMHRRKIGDKKPSFLKDIFKNESLLHLVLQRKNQASLKKCYMDVLGYSNIFNSLRYFMEESYLQG